MELIALSKAVKTCGKGFEIRTMEAALPLKRRMRALFTKVSSAGRTCRSVLLNSTL